MKRKQNFLLELNLPIKTYRDQGAYRCGRSHGLQRINQTAHDSTIRKGPRDDLAKVEGNANEQDRQVTDGQVKDEIVGDIFHFSFATNH